MDRITGDIAAERFVLSALAQKGEEVYLSTSNILDESCFFNTDNRCIYKVLIDGITRYGKLDINTFMSQASDSGLESLLSKRQNVDYVKSLFSVNTVVDNLPKICAKLKKLSIIYNAQKDIEDSHSELNTLTGTEPIDQILSIVEKPITKVGLLENVDSEPINILDQLEARIEYHINNKCTQVGISTGYKYYDYMIGGGLRPGYINLVVARPKSNKSTLGMNMAINISEQDIPVLYLDTEMDPELQCDRILASITNIKYNEIETGLFDDRGKTQYVLSQAKKLKRNFFYKRVAGMEFDEVLSIIKRWTYKHKKDHCVVIYDYFKLMSSEDLGSMSEHQALGFQLSKFTDYLGNNKVACLAFVQANRDGITKESTDIVSQSDRLTWLCSSLALLRIKTPEEIVQEGLDRGDRKLIPMDGMRFSAGLGDGTSKDWINLAFQNFKLVELGTHQNPCPQT